MNNLKIEQQQGLITTNLDAIEAEIKEKMADYKDYLVTEDSIKSDKKVLADLRKTKKELDDARKEVKKAWLEPYEQFEERCKAVIALVDEPINLINDQLKLFDEERVARKREHVKELYDEVMSKQGLEKFLPLEKIYDSKWDNVSAKDQDILFDIDGMILKVKNDLVAIRALNSEIYDECVETYLRFNNDLSMAIQRNSQYLADKQKIAEQTKEIVANPENESEMVEETPKCAPLQHLDDLSKTIRMVHFIVSETDAEQVREILSFANIIYREE